jgi:hypothetical protein
VVGRENNYISETGTGATPRLTTSSQAEDEMKGGFLLDVVVREGPAILELLAGEDEALLVGRDALLVLNLGLDVVDGIARLDLEGDGLAGESPLFSSLSATSTGDTERGRRDSLDKDLHDGR